MRHWRKMTWVLIAWCVLILAWAIAGGAGNDSHTYCVNHPSAYLSLKSCEDARDAGTGIGVALILLIGFVGFVFFSLIWFMTRPKGRECPACGERVKRGRTTCASCGHNFKAAANPSTA